MITCIEKVTFYFFARRTKSRKRVKSTHLIDGESVVTGDKHFRTIRWWVTATESGLTLLLSKTHLQSIQNEEIQLWKMVAECALNTYWYSSIFWLGLFGWKIREREIRERESYDSRRPVTTVDVSALTSSPADDEPTKRRRRRVFSTVKEEKKQKEEEEERCWLTA